MVTLMVAFTVLYMIFTQEEDQYLVYSANIADVGHYSLNCYEFLVGVSLFFWMDQCLCYVQKACKRVLNTLNLIELYRNVVLITLNLIELYINVMMR